MRTARRMLLLTFTIACLTCFNVSDAKKPDNTAGGGGGGGGGVTLEYGIYQLDSDGGAYSGFAEDLNEVGLVVGQAVDTFTGDLFAACWEVSVAADGTVTSQLNLLPDSDNVHATGVNNLGEVVGFDPFLGGSGPGLYWPSVDEHPLVLPPLDGDTDAMKSVDRGLSLVRGEARKRLLKWRNAMVHNHVLQSIRAEMKKGAYAAALTVISDHEQWLDAESSLPAFYREVYDTWASELSKQKKPESAVNVYLQALEALPNDEHLKHNAIGAFDRWAKVQMNEQDWGSAIDLYERALKHFPNNRILRHNLNYCTTQSKTN